ncbi:membrane protein required for colicin V production [Maridesulfovibrio ferrireducens]|uniref:Membrane protein required for colicin V production n=1 Tax=Maridesulfovibrio ferrireducens TaxID=246191 RepID=A0A1G9JMH0_9BACT|nr:CvpA family protein [Maridesulfovibrio ferrireducens]SDL38502.1 membrane protein required for colicin V production [Maridesulfovibrio ferrireducens]
MNTAGLALNSLDIILIVIAAGLVFRGLLRGIVREAISVFSLILGFYLAARYHQELMPYFGNFFDGPGTVKAFSYLSIIAVTILVSVLLGIVIKKILTITMLGWADQALGGLLGLVEAVLVGGILIIILNSFTPNSDFLTKSKLAPKVISAASLLIGFAPDNILESLDIKSMIPEQSQLTNQIKEII